MVAHCAEKGEGHIYGSRQAASPECSTANAPNHVVHHVEDQEAERRMKNDRLEIKAGEMAANGLYTCSLFILTFRSQAQLFHRIG